MVVIDVETSGTNSLEHQILALTLIALVKSKPALQVFIKNDEPVRQDAAWQYFQQYRTEWEQNAVSPNQARLAIHSYVENQFRNPVTLVGHNVGFDAAFLRHLCRQAQSDVFAWFSHRTVDTHTILNFLYFNGLIPEHALSSSGAFPYFTIEIHDAQRHCAMGDAKATRALVLTLLNTIQLNMPSLNHAGI